MEIKYTTESSCKYMRSCEADCNGRYQNHGRTRTCYTPKAKIRRSNLGLEKGLVSKFE